MMLKPIASRRPARAIARIQSTLLALGFALAPLISGAAELPEALPPAVTAEKPPSEIPWLDSSGFLPERPRDEDAVDLYARAAEAMRKLPGFPRVPREPAPYEEFPVREALRLAFRAAGCKTADFLGRYSYRAWEEGQVPPLAADFAIVRAMAQSVRFRLKDGDTQTALRIAQAALSIGDHFLRNAPNLVQADIGQRMTEEAFRSLRACYFQLDDREKAKLAGERMAQARGWELAIRMKSMVGKLERWKDLDLGLGALRDNDPIVRADSLLLIEACFVKAGAARLSEAEGGAAIVARVTSQPDRCNDAIRPLLQDSNSVVQRLAKRVSDVIDSR